MSLSDLAAVTSAISAVAVLASLLFLNRQVHLSEKNQRALIQQGRAGRTADIAMRMMASEFAEFMDQIVTEAVKLPHVDQLAQWRAELDSQTTVL